MIYLDLVYSLAHLEPKLDGSSHFSCVPWAVKSMGPIPMLLDLREPVQRLDASSWAMLDIGASMECDRESK